MICRQRYTKNINYWGIKYMSFTRAKKLGKSYKIFVPKNYQKESIAFGLERPAAGFFLAPGLGKTMILLSIYVLLRKLKLVDEMLVVATKRICYLVWAQEAKKWKLTKHLRFVIVHGPQKEQALYEDADVRLLNYDGLDWLVQQKKWFARKKRVMLTCDESSKLRNSNTQRFKRLKKILSYFTRRYIATGSPAPKGLMGLFSQQYVLDLGESFGPYITHFRNQYFYPSGYMGYDWKMQKGARKRIFKKLRPYVIRFGSNRLKLPPITWIDRYVDLPEQVMLQYRAMERKKIMQIKEGYIKASNAAVATGKLRQIANGGIYTELVKKDFKTMHDEKCEDLVELLDELNGEPALIGYEFKHDAIRLHEYMKKHAPQYAKAPFVHGGVKESIVQRYVNEWNDGELVCMFGQIANVAHGLNLQGKGGIVIYFSQPWSLEDDEQFYQRVYRQGQDKRVLAYRILARNTVDEDVIATLARHDKTQNSLLEAMEKRHGIS